MAEIANEGSTEADGWVAEFQVLPFETNHYILVAVRRHFIVRSMCTVTRDKCR